MSNLDGQPFYCAYENSTASITLINKSEIYSTNTELYTQEEFRMNTNFSINFPPDNRSIYINCINTNVKCTYIICQLGPFTSSSSVAKLSLTLDFYLFHFKCKFLLDTLVYF